jgi:hypothetical protein
VLLLGVGAGFLVLLPMVGREHLCSREGEGKGNPKGERGRHGLLSANTRTSATVKTSRMVSIR